MENLSKSDLQWNRMMDLWVEEKLESPYSELIEYLNGINGEGHFCHFDNMSDNGDLKEYVKTLMTILPEPLKNNLELAYKTYIINPDNISDKDEEILNNCDSVYYENEELINEILRKRASEVKL